MEIYIYGEYAFGAEHVKTKIRSILVFYGKVINKSKPILVLRAI